jgi:hypothetical protein
MYHIVTCSVTVDGVLDRQLDLLDPNQTHNSVTVYYTLNTKQGWQRLLSLCSNSANINSSGLQTRLNDDDDDYLIVRDI